MQIPALCVLWNDRNDTWLLGPRMALILRKSKKEKVKCYVKVSLPVFIWQDTGKVARGKAVTFTRPQSSLTFSRDRNAFFSLLQGTRLSTCKQLSKIYYTPAGAGPFCRSAYILNRPRFCQTDSRVLQKWRDKVSKCLLLWYMFYIYIDSDIASLSGCCYPHQFDLASWSEPLMLRTVYHKGLRSSSPSTSKYSNQDVRSYNIFGIQFCINYS